MSVSIGMTIAVMMLLATASTAQAQPPMPSHFQHAGKDVLIDLRLSKNGKVIMADVDVRVGQCRGDLEGPVPAKVVGRTLVLNKTGYGETCVLRIGFNKNYTRANIREDTCLGWHGVACQFETSGLRRR